MVGLGVQIWRKHRGSEGLTQLSPVWSVQREGKWISGEKDLAGWVWVAAAVKHVRDSHIIDLGKASCLEVIYLLS